jgi:CBS domain-containing protein
MTNVRDILKGKQKQVWSVGPTDSVIHALQILAERDIGALVVEDSFGRAVGIVSERDYARKVTLKGKTAEETLVREVMTPLSEVHGVGPEMTIDDCMLMITEKKVRHLPVFSGKKIIGLVSIGDVLKSTIEAKEMEIEHLSNYIAGTYV